MGKKEIPGRITIDRESHEIVETNPDDGAGVQRTPPPPPKESPPPDPPPDKGKK